MRLRHSRAMLTIAAGAAISMAGGTARWSRAGAGGRQTQPAAQAPGGRGGGRGAAAVATGLFTAVDSNKDGAVTRDELKVAFDKWYGEWDSARADRSRRISSRPA